MGMFNAKTFVDKRLLLNRFWAKGSDWLTLLYTDTALLDAAEMPADFEIMLVGNEVDVPLTGGARPRATFSLTARIQSQPLCRPRLCASRRSDPAVHRCARLCRILASKSIVLDGQVAYVSGFNSKQTDWDGRNHLLYDQGGQSTVPAKKPEPKSSTSTPWRHCHLDPTMGFESKGHWSTTSKPTTQTDGIKPLMTG